MRLKLLLAASYFLITPFFIFILIFYQLYLHHQSSKVSAQALPSAINTVKYSAVPDINQEVTVRLDIQEARVNSLKTFLGRYNSPLLEFSRYIVETADKYGIDYRLLPAIAMQESTLCLKAPSDSNNCWGFGIYGKKLTRFENLPQAIDTISRTMAEKYHAQGLLEPSEIMTKYTPSNTGEWAENVSYVMQRISASL